MTSSRSSSSNRRAGAALAALALLAASACAHERLAMPEVPVRVALLPPENVTGGPVPMREFTARLEAALARSGVEVVTGDAVDRYLTLSRIRYTGGIDGPSARAAKEDLGVDAVLVTWIAERREGPPPRIALAMRLVTATDPPTISWIDTVAMSGDDHPGLFELGVVGSLAELERSALDRAARSLSRFLRGGPRAVPCDRAREATWVRASGGLGSQPGPVSAIVLPFANLTERRGAGELVAMELARQLLAIPGLQVIEPGVIREELLRYRLIMREGPSLDDVLALRAAVQPTLIFSGQVQSFVEAGEPKVGFSVTGLDVATRRITWRSSGYAAGDDGVFFFDAGRTSMATDLVCQMSRGIAQALGAKRKDLAGAAPGRPATPGVQAPRDGSPP